MMWRCVNDFFGYCSKEPDWETLPQKVVLKRSSLNDMPIYMLGGVCKNDPKTCPNYLTQTQVNLNLVAAG